MKTDPILPQARVQSMKQAGFWRGRTLLDYLDDCVARSPERTAIVDNRLATGERQVLTYAELGRRVERIAQGLAALGVGTGDVVSYQLPNWWQFTALHLAALRLGAITNPLMPIFRERELEFMLRLAEAKVFIVPKRFRDFDYEAMANGLRTKLPALGHVLVVGGDGPGAFERLLDGSGKADRGKADGGKADGGKDSGGKAARKPLAERRPAPDDVVEIIFTSGTTGEPKGVMHTSHTLFSNIEPYAERLRLGKQDVVLMASPMAHQTGFMYGLMMPIFLGGISVLLDTWNPARAVDLVAAERVSFTMASTPFLLDLTNEAEKRKQDVDTLHTFLSAGAPIPRSLVRRAADGLGARIVSAWGMTENGAVTTTRPDDRAEKIFETDGCPLPGMELRTIDPEGRPLGPDQQGRLQVRGCSNFVGYLKRPEWYGTDAEGWFDTGDLARLDADGYVRITGRSKDILIRGGENVPVVEIEDLIYQHPAVLETAIVGMPDPRLGERGCAFVTLRPGQSLTLKELVAFLETKKVAKQYLPERLEVIPALPKTPSGKVQKFRLREMAKAFGQAAPGA